VKRRRGKLTAETAEEGQRAQKTGEGRVVGGACACGLPRCTRKGKLNGEYTDTALKDKKCDCTSEFEEDESDADSGPLGSCNREVRKSEGPFQYELGSYRVCQTWEAFGKAQRYTRRRPRRHG
jgi:hypothetical protein